MDLDNSALIEQLSQIETSDTQELDTITVDPIERHVLKNGLRVLIGRSTVVPAVSMQIYQLGGLLADPP